MAGMLLMGILGIGLLLALLLTVIWIAGRLFPFERRSASALTRVTLQRRYAAGEISEAEYLRALQALDHSDRLLV
jgi:uncharacterized membrane protein